MKRSLAYFAAAMMLLFTISNVLGQVERNRCLRHWNPKTGTDRDAIIRALSKSEILSEADVQRPQWDFGTEPDGTEFWMGSVPTGWYNLFESEVSFYCRGFDQEELITNVFYISALNHVMFSTLEHGQQSSTVAVKLLTKLFNNLDRTFSQEYCGTKLEVKYLATLDVYVYKIEP